MFHTPNCNKKSGAPSDDYVKKAGALAAPTSQCYKVETVPELFNSQNLCIFADSLCISGYLI